MISTLKCDMSELSLKCDSSFFLQNKILRNKAHTHTNFNKVKFIFFFKIKFPRGHIYNKRLQFSKLFFLCLWSIFSQNCNFLRNQGRVQNWMFFTFVQSAIQVSKTHVWPPMKFLQTELIIETTLATTKTLMLEKGK